MDTVIRILYGSETGTAQDVAEQLWKSAKRKGLQSTVSSLDDYDINNLTSERLIIFVIATTGQGDCPTNMKRNWRYLLRKVLPPTMLQNLKYAVLGLGDSSYQKFNFAARKLNTRIAQLGGTELLPIGLADDQDDLGIDDIVDPWVKNMWDVIANIFGISIEDNVYKKHLIFEKYNIAIQEMNQSNVINSNRNIYAVEISLNDKIHNGTIIENKRTTTEDHFQDVRLIKLEATNMQYEPGDVMYIRPRNSIKRVKQFFNILHEHNIQLFPDTIIQVSEKEIKVPYVLQQFNLTLQEIVEQYWDLNFKPRRSTMHVLSLISENELEKEKLYEFTTPDGQEELYNYINRPRRNILELLADFPHTTSKLNITLLFEIMSPIKPRAYSIASSLRATRNTIQILVAVVKFKTRLVEPRFGLCSNWLANLKKDDELIFWIQKGTFRFAENRPMILIGPGTGVAPFRSLLLDRALIQENMRNYILFFGCRNEKKDYHCREDVAYLSCKKDLRIFCAFSRDQDHKIYVQHIIHQQKELCWQFLQNDAYIYLAGNSKNMPNDVRDEIVNLVEELGKMSRDSAEMYVKNLEKTNRYQCETWS